MTDRSDRKHRRLREIVYQPEVYFTTGTPDPIRVCNSTTTMDADADDPRAWYHPDLGQLGGFVVGDFRAAIGANPNPIASMDPNATGPVRTVQGRRCRFCQYIVVEE